MSLLSSEEFEGCHTCFYLSRRVYGGVHLRVGTSPSARAEGFWDAGRLPGVSAASPWLSGCVMAASLSATQPVSPLFY